MNGHRLGLSTIVVRVLLGVFLGVYLGACLGCSKPETEFTVYNAGPEKLTNVNLTVGDQLYPLGDMNVEEQKHLATPPILGKTVAFNFDGISIPTDERVIPINLPENRYGEVSITFKAGRCSQALSAHP